MGRPFAADVAIAVASSNGKADASGSASAAPNGVIFWSQRGLTRVPTELFAPAAVAVALAASLVRLDLSFNRLDCLPDALSALASLRELFVNSNPRLAALPAALATCQQLRVLDASSTALAALPSELGRLEQLRVLAIDGTPLERKWIDKRVLPVPQKTPDTISFLGEYYETSVSPDGSSATSTIADQAAAVTPCYHILRELRRKDERARLKSELRDKLRFAMYRLDGSDTQAAAHIDAALKRVVKLFPQVNDLRALVRNAERFLPRAFSPGAMEEIDAIAVRKAFDVLAQENERKKRAADLELKLRAIYFDRVEPPVVESMVQRIYAHVPALADVKFLIAHAAEVLPADPKDVDGAVVQRKIVELQRQLASERQAAVDKLHAAVKGIYSDTEPDQVQTLVAQVAALFKVGSFFACIPSVVI